MLVLTRKLQQQVKIGDHITVTILRVKGHTVRIGIEAPRDVRVVRGELPPKADNSPAEPSEATIIEALVTVSDESAEAAADEAEVALEGESAGQPAAPLALPPNRVLSRMGKAPLRQIMANASLAK
jgi:carbon storage regulator CsrA